MGKLGVNTQAGVEVSDEALKLFRDSHEAFQLDAGQIKLLEHLLAYGDDVLGFVVAKGDKVLHLYRWDNRFAGIVETDRGFEWLWSMGSKPATTLEEAEEETLAWISQ